MGARQSQSPVIDTVDLTGKVAVVTGGNRGIGYATAKALAVMGAHTIIACRSSQRATAALNQMKQEVQQLFPDKTINVEYMLMDLASFRSTKDFTVAFKEKNLPCIFSSIMLQCHQCLEEGEPMWLSRIKEKLNESLKAEGLYTAASQLEALTEDGHETNFQVQHLSPLLLILELLPIMLYTASNTGDGRIVFLNTAVYSFGVFNPENLEGQQSYGKFAFYCHSKLYNMMTAYALQRRLQNVGITLSSLNPGYVKTESLTNYVQEAGIGTKILLKPLLFFASPFARSADAGAVNPVNCAVNPRLNSQQHVYYNTDGSTGQTSAAARNESHQEQLWEISINMIKEFLTPEVLERYGPTLSITQQGGEERVERAISDTHHEGDTKQEEVSSTHEGDVKQEQEGQETELDLSASKASPET